MVAFYSLLTILIGKLPFIIENQTYTKVYMIKFIKKCPIVKMFVGF